MDVASGSPLLVIADSAKQAELDAQIILAGGEARGIGFETQAQLSRFLGRQVGAAGYANAGSTLLSGVGNVATRHYKRTGGDGSTITVPSSSIYAGD